MNCKRCQAPLPLTGYICPHCGKMMTLDQIKVQKEQMKINNNTPFQMVSEKYGHKQFIYKKREEEKKKYWGLFLILGILLLVFLIGVFVYF